MGSSDDNRRTYEDASVVESYRSASQLTAAEVKVLASLPHDLGSSRLLDIGVGAGRTTGELASTVAHYVGIDYSHGLVAAARRRHPGVDLSWGDARDLARFPPASFDVVHFSFNGIDYVDHADRLRVHHEVHRVLAPGGAWTFSTHNRAYVRRGMLPWQGRIRPGRVMLRKSVEALAARGNRRRLRAQEVETVDYALVNDDAHHYSLLTYYISADSQLRQLADAGFVDGAVFDQRGDPTDGPSTESIWLHYSCRRP